jgi:hypothetical protein
MSMQQYNNLMTHDIKIRKRKRNKSGDFYDLSDSTVKGFCQYGDVFYTDEKGEKKLAAAIVFLKDDCGIDIKYRYWMLDQLTPYNRPNLEVLKIDPVDDPRTGKTHHYECFCR